MLLEIATKKHTVGRLADYVQLETVCIVGKLSSKILVTHAVLCRPVDLVSMKTGV